MIGILDSFTVFWERIYQKVKQDSKKAQGTIVTAFVLSVLAGILQAHYGVIPAGQLRFRILLSLTPPAIVFFSYLSYYVARAPWLLQRDLQKEIDDLKFHNDTLEKSVKASAAEYQDSPKISLIYQKTDSYDGFALLNCGSPGMSAHVQIVKLRDSFLSSSFVGAIPTGITPIDLDYVITGVRGHNPAQPRTYPEWVTGPEKLKEFIFFMDDYVKQNGKPDDQLVDIEITLKYGDHYFLLYETPCKITWNTQTHTIHQIQPGATLRFARDKISVHPLA